MRIDHRPRLRASLRPCLGAVLLLAPLVARAETPGALGDASIVYDAPPGCPSETEFEARVKSRIAPRATPATALRRIEAKLETSPSRTSASIVLTDTGGVTTARRIVAATCDEAVDALALIVALTVDPEEQRASPSSSADGDRVAPESTREPTPAASSSADVERRGAVDNENDSAKPNEPAEPLATAHESSKDGTRARFDASAAFLVASGVGPGVRPGAEVAVAGYFTKAPSFAVRAGARFVAPSSLQGSLGDAKFSWWTGFASACLGDAAGPLEAEGCAAYELGRFSASGSNTLNPGTFHDTWQAVGPELRLRWPVASTLAVGLSLGAMFPVQRQRFSIAEDALYQVPVVALRGEIGATVRF